MKQLQLAIKRGEYYLADDVRRRVRLHITTARSVMSGKAYGLAMILASLTGADAVEIEQRIRARDKEVIQELHSSPVAVETVKCECGKEIKL